ncbi:hypothetical protein HYN43_014515 [Mucilaginibacter celer]|uniref:Uncharacterized protein n=1 Tax=Mucilaginibacter celer TaxID=2305508 RepID=A0A494VNZ8_9SPHI|nr:hypothetical protein HYN43_014515 [Mucilaginibacter celer]
MRFQEQPAKTTSHINIAKRIYARTKKNSVTLKRAVQSIGLHNISILNIGCVLFTLLFFVGDGFVIELLRVVDKAE